MGALVQCVVGAGRAAWAGAGGPGTRFSTEWNRSAPAMIPLEKRHVKECSNLLEMEPNAPCRKCCMMPCRCGRRSAWALIAWRNRDHRPKKRRQTPRGSSCSGVRHARSAAPRRALIGGATIPVFVFVLLHYSSLPLRWSHAPFLRVTRDSSLNTPSSYYITVACLSDGHMLPSFGSRATVR